MIRIAICEDEPVFLERLKNMAAGILVKYAAAYSIEVFSNGTPLLTRGTFDILLLDIEMQPYNGIELARKLRERHEEGRIIFITAYEQYAIEAYDVQAFHYLLKPVEEGKLEETLVKACDLLKKEEDQCGGYRFKTCCIWKLLTEKFICIRRAKLFRFTGN